MLPKPMELQRYMTINLFSNIGHAGHAGFRNVSRSVEYPMTDDLVAEIESADTGLRQPVKRRVRWVIKRRPLRVRDMPRGLKHLWTAA